MRSSLSMTAIDEIAPDLFRLSVYVPDIDMQFNHFLVRDDEPLLFHTGARQLFPLVAEAVSKIIAVDRLRWVSFGHVESDESGATNQWLAAAPGSEVLFNGLGCMVSLNDLCDRPPVVAEADAARSLGTHAVRTIATPHVPHGWEAQVLFDEVTRTLFCGDLFTQVGDGPALVHGADLIQPALDAEDMFGATALTAATAPTLRTLAALEPRTLALMHGPAYAGDGRQALLDLADAYEARLDSSLRVSHSGAI